MCEKTAVILIVLLVLTWESTGDIVEIMSGMQDPKEENKKDLLASGHLNDINLNQGKERGHEVLLSLSDMDTLRLLRAYDNALMHNTRDSSNMERENVGDDFEMKTKDLANVAGKMNDRENIKKTSNKREGMHNHWLSRAKSWLTHKGKRELSKNDNIIASSANRAGSLVKKTQKRVSKEINAMSSGEKKGSAWVEFDNNENKKISEDLTDNNKADLKLSITDNIAQSIKRRENQIIDNLKKRVVRPWLIRKGKREMNNDDNVYISHSNAKKESITNQEKEGNKFATDDIMNWLDENRQQIDNKLGNHLRAIDGNEENANYNDDDVHESMTSLQEKRNMEDESTNEKAKSAWREQYGSRNTKAKEYYFDIKDADDQTKKNY